VYFYSFAIISPWWGAIPVKSSTSKDDLCQVWLKLAQWFWRRFLNDPTPFLHFYDYLPFEKHLALYLNKFEFPLPKDNLYQVWLNLACWFWRRFLKKIFSVFLLFRYYLPFESSYPLPLNKFESRSPKDDLCQVWLKLAQWFWRRSRKYKSLTDRRTDRQTMDNGRSEKLTWAFRSGELKSLKEKQGFCFYLSLVMMPHLSSTHVA
jgi:hypothetical protein